MIDVLVASPNPSVPPLFATGGSLKFGTSGLRGLVTDLVGLPSRAYATAFVQHMAASGCLAGQGEVLIGRDLRSSSPQIGRDCAFAVTQSGWRSVDCGELPTPALALEARRRGCPAIMVTGSHIPDDRNGLKFYRPDGEITKEDEIAISARYKTIDEATLAALSAGDPGLGHPGLRGVGREALAGYVDRYLRFFGAGALQGLRIGVYQHSSVARDCLVEVLTRLGAETVAFGLADSFVAVDTEAYDPQQAELIRQTAQTGGLAAIVSTDGDADRPMVADENGRILRGDVLGLVTAAFLGSATIVTPVTSGAVIDRSGIASRVVRTRVGSPFVIEAMDDAASNGGTVIGFEANGGVLLGTDMARNGRTLAALPTRDAFLPILAILSMAKERQLSLSRLVDDLDIGFALADRLQHVPGEASRQFLSRLALDRDYAAAFFAPVGMVKAVDDLDGLRFQFVDGSILHFRASGNAPELRCYVEAQDRGGAEALLAWGLRAASSALSLGSQQKPGSMV